jgi:signal peptidase II
MKKTPVPFLISRFHDAFLPVTLVWLIDRQSKTYALERFVPLEWGYLRLETTFNHGIVMGLLSHLPEAPKVAVLTTIACLLLVTFALASWLAPMRSLSLRIGLGVCLGGIWGNVTDRLLGNGVVDFIQLTGPGWSSPIFNAADLLQFVGYALVIYGIVQDGRHWWPKKDWRGGVIINLKHQLRVGMLFSALGACSSLCMLVFSYSFFRSSLAPELMETFLFVGFGLTAVVVVGFGWLGVVLSHRVAGPMFAIKRHLRLTIEGKSLPFKLRVDDEFKEMEEIVSEMNSAHTDLLEAESLSNVVPLKKAS